VAAVAAVGTGAVNVISPRVTQGFKPSVETGIETVAVVDGTIAGSNGGQYLFVGGH